MMAIDYLVAPGMAERLYNTLINVFSKKPIVDDKLFSLAEFSFGREITLSIEYKPAQESIKLFGRCKGEIKDVELILERNTSTQLIPKNIGDKLTW